MVCAGPNMHPRARTTTAALFRQGRGGRTGSMRKGVRAKCARTEGDSHGTHALVWRDGGVLRSRLGGGHRILEISHGGADRPQGQADIRNISKYLVDIRNTSKISDIRIMEGRIDLKGRRSRPAWGGRDNKLSFSGPHIKGWRRYWRRLGFENKGREGGAKAAPIPTQVRGVCVGKNQKGQREANAVPSARDRSYTSTRGLSQLNTRHAIRCASASA